MPAVQVEAAMATAQFKCPVCPVKNTMRDTIELRV